VDLIFSPAAFALHADLPAHPNNLKLS
jgi:hypothetical protein